MSSRSYSMEKSKASGFNLTLNRRLFLVFLACCIQMIYIPTSNRVTGGVEPRLPIDIFPIWPVWILPYLLCYGLWLAGIVWVIFKRQDHDFRAFIAACMFTFAIGALTFIFFPTYVEPATIAGKDIFSSLLRTIHDNLGRYAALPSGHVYITTLLALFYGRWYPHHRYLWTAILIVVSLSTLFTAQHYILDVVGGYLVALAGYHFGLWWSGHHPAQNRSGVRSKKRIASSTN